MSSFNKKQTDARPDSGRVFSSFRSHIVLPDLTAYLIFLALVGGGLALDLWTKSAVFEWLRQKPNRAYSVIDGFFQLVTALNDGAAFGLFAGHPGRLIAVSVIALIVIFVFFLFGGIKQRLTQAAFGLFMAGVLGNLFDRIFNDGQVRDFIDIYYGRYHWPAFNIADSMLCIAVALIIVSSFSICSKKEARGHSSFDTTEKSAQKRSQQRR